MFLFDFVFLGSAQRGPSPKCPGGLLKCSGVSEELSPRQQLEIEGRRPNSHYQPRSNPFRRRCVPSSEWRQLNPTTLLYLQEKRESAAYQAASHLCTRGGPPRGQ
ncbi:hypothetical protein AVEN_78398-1 [Araneus ventricosus]|uniref:Uncharacterized protein n=1 Tax=Araneus ventricosus TaxID=182803 RepID=A0A4Y2PFS6_ARAVE|nr:hypothetical protein AVEN_78398-1 [Araneus ventricosus]